jgi:uncharacterized protein YjbI with pentapeptide repeats
MNRIFSIMLAIALLALGVTLVLTGPAGAQDANQIAKVQNGGACPSCNLFQADLAYRDLAGALLSAARLRQADFSLATLNRADFSDADLSVSNGFGARFSGANFAGADLREANFTGAYLGYANLRGAKLNGAVLNGANLEGTKNLTQAQLNTACGDEYTHLPAGMTIPRCG